MCGPGAPVTKALLWCGWKVIPVDILLEPEHDLGDKALQNCLHSKLQHVDCILAAWTAPQSRGLVRFRFTLQMVALALNLCVQLNILKDCPTCHPGMQLECSEITWRLTLC